VHWAWELWPYALAGGSTVLWAVTLRIHRKLLFALLAFAAGVLANLTVDQLCLYLVPVDVAGTPPPDPRNVIMRLRITAAAQIPACLLVSYLFSRWWRRSCAPARRT